MNEHISFAQEVKEEVGKNLRSLKEERAFLSSLARENGAYRLVNGRLSISIHSELASTAKAVYRAMKNLYGLSPRFSYSRSTSLRGKTLFHVLVEERVEEILNDLEIDYFSPRFPNNIIQDKEEVASYLSGSFLAGGSVNDPKRPNYHLELKADSEEYAKWLSSLLNKKAGYPFESKITARRNQYVVYLKKADQVSNFLILIHANKACLHFENIRIDRDFANMDNRMLNLDAANFRKTLESGSRQVERIKEFDRLYGIDTINKEKLRLLLRLRLKNPEATLNELAEELSLELGEKVSRSNINHLFRSFEKRWSDGEE